MKNYILNEIKDIDGSILYYKVRAKSGEHAVAISKAVEGSSVFKELAQKLPSPRLLSYFKFIIEEEIKPFIKNACVIDWCYQNGKSLSSGEDVVLLPNFGIFEIFANCWSFKNAKARLVSPFSPMALKDNACREAIINAIRNRIKNSLLVTLDTGKSFKKRKSFGESFVSPTLACHYLEGVDFSKRNDLNWYEGSGIDPKRVLVYMDMSNKRAKKEAIEKIEKMGLNWVSLKKGAVEHDTVEHWYPTRFSDYLVFDEKDRKNKPDRWIRKESNVLLRLVHHWSSFYKDFNIKINYVPEEGVSRNIAQAIAFDIEKCNKGILVVKQKSELYHLSSYDLLAFFPHHLIFNWHARAENYLSPKCQHIENMVVSGYPNDIFNKNINFCKDLRNNNAKFIIALFDNTHGSGDNIPLSTNDIAELYKAFLEWVIKDPEVGLTIKSKRPSALNSVPGIGPLLDIAIKTGRCMRIGNEAGRFPSDAAFGADIAVGAGFSSAVVESVITGSKGILYDMTHLRGHEFYNWGNGSLIFDDLEKMMNSLKEYKNNKETTKLGDWTSYLDKLDPFRDSKGGQRMGSFMKWTLDGYDLLKDRNEAIKHASKLYVEKWGSDKVINMNKAKSPEVVKHA